MKEKNEGLKESKNHISIFITYTK